MIFQQGIFLYVFIQVQRRQVLESWWITEPIEKAELIHQPSGVKCIKCLVPMHFSGGMYVVYQQLSEDKRRDFAYIKSTLYTAFALVSAWKEFMVRKLHPEETVDVYLAELRRFFVLFVGMSEKGLTCAFIVRMPKSVEELLQASS